MGRGVQDLVYEWHRYIHHYTPVILIYMYQFLIIPETKLISSYLIIMK